MKPALIALGAAAVLSMIAPPLAANTVSVVCDSVTVNRLGDAVNQLRGTNPNGPNTISISGTCPERGVIIESLRNLTIDGGGGGTIRALGPTEGLVAIVDSFTVTLIGLTVSGAPSKPARLVWVLSSQNVGLADATVEQGQTAVSVDKQSDVWLRNVTLTDSGVGVRVDHNSTVEFRQTTTMTGSSTGLSVLGRSTVAVNGPLKIENRAGGGFGISADQSDVTISGCGSGSYVRGANIGLGATHGSISVNCPLSVEDNALYGALGGSFSLGGGAVIRRNGPNNHDPNDNGRGVFVFGGEELMLAGAQVIDNYGPGIEINRGSSAVFSGATISGNQGDGIKITELSVAGFILFYGPNVFSANAGDDVACDTTGHGYGFRPTAAKLKCATFNWQRYEK